ncbi:MAG TPA: type II toxin-antitoxin system HigB family toxin [Dyadobacter sp.]|nr:type II toxin-antitoxin system HigB family toxin [Dyadobacter sp.]
MRVFTKATLRDFWDKTPDARASLEFWYDTIEKTNFSSPNEVIWFFKNADRVGNGRIVFNITHNKYRLVAKFEYEMQFVFVRFLGTRSAYDKIEDIKNISLIQSNMKTLAINLDDIVIKPITNDADFEEAGKIIDTLIDADLLADPKERKKALDILEAVTVLAIDYEKKTFPIPKPDPIEAIKERMDQLHLSRKDVAPYFGGENRVSKVLNKKRNLTIKMIRELNKNLGIPVDTLLTIS